MAPILRFQDKQISNIPVLSKVISPLPLWERVRVRGDESPQDSLLNTLNVSKYLAIPKNLS